MSKERESVLDNAEIKSVLLNYHRNRGFRLYDTFPLISDDPTVLFTNATITPFKHFFDGEATPHNYALAQRCLRVGGGAGELETARADPNYSSLFDMFGSGLFECNHEEAVAYFVGMLVKTGLPIENLRFVVPESRPFAGALLASGIARTSIFSINENREFWHEWRFGKNSLIGSGLTAVFSRNDEEVGSVDEMAVNHEAFVEIGNLIHIYGKVSSGNILPVSHQGFETGIGLCRLAIILQGRTLYELQPLKKLMDVTAAQMELLAGRNFDGGTLRVIVDHLRAIDALIAESLRPSNKQHGYVLRKLIRSLLETMWVSAGKIVSPAEMVLAFASHDAPASASIIQSVVSEEERVFRSVLEQGRRVLAKNPGLAPETLKSTYGIRQSLIPLMRK